MTDTATPLTIPDEAIEVACNAYEAAILDETPKDSSALENHEEIAAVRAAAPLIVAAELDRLAREIDNAPYPYEVLERRAAELRAGAS